MSIFDVILRLIGKMMEFLSLGTTRTSNTIKNGLGVYVKSNTGNTIYVELDPTWDIHNIKAIIAPKLGLSVHEIKIIFAGRELLDSVTINECDLGQKSVLHAVRTTRRRAPAQQRDQLNALDEELDDGFKSLSESLLEHEIHSDQSNALPSTESNPAKPLLKAHFYVYCSNCNGLRHGKLRVRCSMCRGGAFTVHKDPENWTDVLKARRIRGHCESSDVACVEDTVDERPPFAEFYFKCAEHESEGETDFSAPLNLIKTNVNGIPCLSCFEREDLVLVFPCATGHVICLECFRTYLRTRLLERRFVRDERVGFSVDCPVGCEASLIEEVHHFRVLPADEYERYQQFATEEYVLQNGGVLCPQPGCGMGLMLDEEQIASDPTCTRIQCQNGCGFVFCRLCRQGYHLGDCLTEDSTEAGTSTTATSATTTFDIDPQRAAVSSFEASTVAIRILTKPCPKCRSPTERDGGCMHMVCTKSGCDFEWCWVCQIKWSTDCMGAHWFG